MGVRENVKNIFVGNLSFSATEADIRSMFEAYGSVDRVSIITDAEIGRLCGFAFVEVPDDTQADGAIAEVNGSQGGGRQLNVNEARPKGEGGGGGRGFGGGGGGRERRGGGGGYRDRRGGY